MFDDLVLLFYLLLKLLNRSMPLFEQRVYTLTDMLHHATLPMALPKAITYGIYSVVVCFYSVLQ